MNEWLALTMLALVFAFATLIRVLLGPVATEPASSRDTTPWWPSYTTALDQAVQRQLLLQLAVSPTSLQGIELPPSHPVPVDRQTDPVLGWRFWSLRQGFSESGHTTMWLLTSMNDTVWRPRVAMRATCEAGRLVPFQAVPPNPFHDAPTQQCTCGVYAFRPESFINGIWQAPLGCVVGEIKGWGRVMEHQLGWRAASAYPSSIFLFCAWCYSEGHWTRADWVGFGSLSGIVVPNALTSLRRMARVAALVPDPDTPMGICDRHWDAPANRPPIRGHVHSAADVTARLLADYGVKEAAPPGADR